MCFIGIHFLPVFYYGGCNKVVAMQCHDERDKGKYVGEFNTCNMLHTHTNWSLLGTTGRKCKHRRKAVFECLHITSCIIPRMFYSCFVQLAKEDETMNCVWL